MRNCRVVWMLAVVWLLAEVALWVAEPSPLSA